VARPESRYVCQACGASSARWEGRCHHCGAWDSLVETILRPAPSERPARRGPGGPVSGDPGEAVPLRDVASEPVGRLSVGIAEVDRVLGGGLVPGALVLLGGEPGIGKSTLVLETAAGVLRQPAGHGPVVYATGEESSQQLHLRADRLGLVAGPAGDGVRVLASTDLGAILSVADALAPRLLVVDSVQTLTNDGLEGPAGSVGQVREAAARLGAWAHERGTPVVLVGHVTKDGSLAGPRTLEHLVDVVLQLEGDRYGPLRLLRTSKNRFGSTEEVGVLEMTGEGLREVADPARAFLGDDRSEAPGVAIAAVLEGTRPLMVEVQALVAPAGIGVPRRTVAGLDPNRLSLLVAVLARRCGTNLTPSDLYASLAGGASVEEPALDLPLALALVSSYRDRPVRPGLIACGEVSLLGELRPVRGLDRRLREAARLGFREALVPPSVGLPGRIDGLEVAVARTLRDALDRAIVVGPGTSGEG
jgi:DNA repair protein RadA/Sms